MVNALRPAVKPVMRTNVRRSARRIRKEGHTLIRKAKIADYEKKALTVLMDDLLKEGSSTPEQVVKRIRVAIQVNESLAPELAKIDEAVDAIFHSR